MIHEAFNISEVAVRYYALAKPAKKYDKVAARKQFAQDSKIDRKILLRVMKSIHSEAMVLARAK